MVRGYSITILTSVSDNTTDDMPDAPLVEEDASQDAPLDKVTPKEPTENEATVTIQGGRRRGRRRVMKKKTVKNEDGYLGGFYYCLHFNDTNLWQSRRKNPPGNHFQKPNLSQRNQSPRSRSLQAQQRARRLANPDKEILLAFSKRADLSTNDEFAKSCDIRGLALSHPLFYLI